VRADAASQSRKEKTAEKLTLTSLLLNLADIVS
jgi:hypothetical protein